MDQSLAIVTHVAPIDIIVLAGIFVCVTFLVYSSGVYRASALAIALLVTKALMPLAEGTIGLGGIVKTLDTPTTQAIFFVIFFVVLYVVIERMFFSFGGLFGGFMHAVLSALAVVAVVAVTWSTTPAFIALLPQSAITAQLFASQFSIIWVVGALGALAFVSA